MPPVVRGRSPTTVTLSRPLLQPDTRPVLTRAENSVAAGQGADRVDYGDASAGTRKGSAVTIDVARKIAAGVAQQDPVNGIRIIGIDGPSGSGKSFLATRVSKLLAAPVIEIDDFVSWDCFADWWPRFDTQVLTPLLAGRDALYQARDWNDWYGSTLGSWKTQPWSPTIVLEGVTCTRRETIGRLAYAVWVDAPANLRLARGMARDTAFPGKEALWRRWMREEDAFFAADDTRNRADIIVDTSMFGVPTT